MNSLPIVNAATAEYKERIRKVIQARQLVSAANDTKWTKLVEGMRTRKGWRPSYRYKCVGGSLSDWDVEWWCHLPIPMVSVEIFDIALVEKVHRGRLLNPKLIDHGDWILELLTAARFCYEVHGDIVRLFGYLPKNYDGLTDEPPNTPLQPTAEKRGG